MRIQRLLAALSAASAMVSAAPAGAAPITYHFGGIFEFQFGLAPAGLVGSAFSGTLTYDTAAAVGSTPPNSIVYVPGSATMTLQTLFGSGSINAGSGAVGSRWDQPIAAQLGGLFDPADELAVGGSAGYSGALSVFELLGLQLLDGTGGTPDDPFGAPGSPLPSVLDLGQMDAASITLFAAGTVGGVFRTTASAVGRIDCLSTDAAACPAVVPEPSALWLLGAGFLAMRGVRRRHARR